MEEMMFPISLQHNKNKKDKTRVHTFKKTQQKRQHKKTKQTDASMEHLGCYLRRISSHKGDIHWSAKYLWSAGTDPRL